MLTAGAVGCKAKTPAITGPFADTFDRAELGATWLDTGARFAVKEGKLNGSGARNHPVWLRQRLPRDVVVEIDAMSKSPDGDLKVELFGDGESFDPDGNDYTSTGYVFIFGGWHNTLSVIARNYEHDDGVKAQRNDVKVEPGRTYRWTITRKGNHIDWKIDGKDFLSFTDPSPLEGPKHEFFAVNNWDADVYFDNLRIRPAP